MSINTQNQIRDSALELQDFLKDLKQWESKIKEKDKNLKSQTQGVSDLPPVRGHEGSKSLHAVEHTYGGKAGSEVSEGRQRKDKALHDTAAKHTYDYFRDKWDKFDVEAALKEIDENDVPSSSVLQDDQGKKRVQDARKSVNQSRVSDSRFVPQVAERPKAEPVNRNGTPSIVKCQSSDSFVDATAEKEMGNSFFKEKKYVQAIECYSRSIALQPSAVSYANRAMAYIKIRRFKEAEADCTEAIGFDDRYVKAYSRRSTSRKELGDFLGAVSDAEFALRLEPENKELKEQYIHAKALCEKMMNVKPDEKKIPVPIEELRATSNINGSSDAKAHHMYKEESSLHPSPMPREQYPKHDEGAGKNGKVVFSAEAVAASIAAARAATQAKLTAPNNFYEFEAVWKGFTSNPLQQAELLKVIKPSTLPHMFKDNLSPKLLGEILRALELLFPENASHAVDILESLTLSKRFGITAMCLSSKEKKELQRLWEEVFSVSQFDEEKMHVLDRLRPKFLV